MIPNESALHEHLVALYDAVRADGSTGDHRVKLREAVHLLSILYGDQEMARVMDTARMESKL